MKRIASELAIVVEEAGTVLNSLTSQQWEESSAEGKWTRKEILGHLIDSAANNHHRFIRAQYESVPSISYNQELWTALQFYKEESVENLVRLWVSYNKHLAYIISRMPVENYDRLCDINKNEPITLKNVITDYLIHLRHHLNQIIIK